VPSARDHDRAGLVLVAVGESVDIHLNVLNNSYDRMYL
jgi:hypothetical protein